MFWYGVRYANNAMVPVLVLRSWKFKIGIYIALFAALIWQLSDFANVASIWTIIQLILFIVLLGSIWKVVDNQ